MDFFHVDVFAGQAFQGNPLAVFPDAPDLSTEHMQAIANELNLSETTFVTKAESDSYNVRIFTPNEELPFAGHPTIGTAWLLRELGRIAGNVLRQHSPAGVTAITEDRGILWFERDGRADADLEEEMPTARADVAAAMGLRETDLDLEAREMGRPGVLRPAVANAGLEQLMVPVTDVATLGRAQPRNELLGKLPAVGVYAIAPFKAGGLRARGFFPGLGISEDPGTGSAAAALGLYLERRLGSVDIEVVQGVEMGRPCHVHLKAADGKVKIGGACSRVLRGTLEQLP